MIVSKSIIIDRLNTPYNDPKSLVITPLVDNPEKKFDDDSLDLRLGNYFLITRSDRLAVNIPGSIDSSYYRSVHMPLGKYLTLPGRQTILASVLEFIKLPVDFSAMVLTKSSWARTFMTVESAPWVHPCYRGCLTLEITNSSETPILLYPGYPIAQLVFFQNSDCQEGSAEYIKRSKNIKGSYIGPVKPEPGKMRQPKELKIKFGINKIDHPFDVFVLKREEIWNIIKALKKEEIKTTSTEADIKIAFDKIWNEKHINSCMENSEIINKLLPSILERLFPKDSKPK